MSSNDRLRSSIHVGWIPGFFCDWGAEHETSSPHHHQSNALMAKPSQLLNPWRTWSRNAKRTTMIISKLCWNRETPLDTIQTWVLQRWCWVENLEVSTSETKNNSFLQWRNRDNSDNNAKKDSRSLLTEALKIYRTYLSTAQCITRRHKTSGKRGGGSDSETLSSIYNTQWKRDDLY